MGIHNGGMEFDWSTSYIIGEDERIFTLNS